jgi:hypothetical protein
MGTQEQYHGTLAHSPERLSAMEAVWQRQMWFSSSNGAIATGLRQQVQSTTQEGVRMRLYSSGNRDVHVPIIAQHPSDSGWTDMKIWVFNPVHYKDGSVGVTAATQVNVYYADSAGPKTKMFTRNREPEHARDHDEWFTGPATKIIRSFQGRHFDSPDAAKAELTRRLVPSFNNMYNESRKRDLRPGFETIRQSRS